MLVTGANGMLGCAACRSLRESCRVTALHRDKRSVVSVDADISTDLTDRQDLEARVARRRFDVVLHCAAVVNVDRCERDPDFAYRGNVVATQNLLETVASYRFVFVSTDQVYGDSTDRSEKNSDLRPINEYGRSKLRAEEIVAKSAGRFLTLRTNIFGTSAKPERINSSEWMLTSLRTARPIRLFHDYLFSPVYSRSFVEIALQLVRDDVTGVFNVGACKGCSKLSFGLEIASQFGLSSTAIQPSSVVDHAFDAPRPTDLRLATDKLERTGIQPPCVNESIIRWKNDLNTGYYHD